MIRYLVALVFFLAGLAVIGWVGADYVGSNTLALAVTALIGTIYLAGAAELWSYQQGTAGLRRAASSLTAPPESLATWLDQVPSGLRTVARMRVEGERAAFPGPALTPYLVGMLVLLGMLGTFLGMVATLRGTGVALESAIDLHAIRSSLAAPVQGLGFAFGTSVAGVASSATLGLLVALARRERLRAVQQLDTASATALRGFSQSHQREQTLQLMQKQADTMPLLVDRLQAMVATLEQQSHALNERLAASQEAFHGKADAAYTRLATAMEQALRQSVADNAAAAGAAIQPAVEATLAGLARETSAWQDTLAHAIRQQLGDVTGRFEATTTAVAGIWTDALAQQQAANETLNHRLDTTLQRFTDTFEQRSSGLLDNVASRLDTTAAGMSAAWAGALAQQTAAGVELSQQHERALTAATTSLQDQSNALLRSVSQSHADLQAELVERDELRLTAWKSSLDELAQALRLQWEQASAQATDQQRQVCDTLAQTAQTLSADTQAQARETIAEVAGLVQAAAAAPQAAAEAIATWNTTLDDIAATLRQQWEHASALAASQQQQLCETLERTAQELSAQTQAQSRDTIAEVAALVHTAAEAPKAAAQAITTWNDTLDGIAVTLRDQWEHASALAADQQQQLCETLARTTQELSAQTQAHARDTIAEVAQLVQTAAEAPKAAASVIAELRQKLTDSMARDNAMLDERSKLMETLSTLLDAVNHASSQQRTAVDELIATSAGLLDRVGAQFTAQVEAETDKLGGIAAQVTSGAVEVASLGETFGASVQAFGQSSDKLIDHLQRIEAALDKSLARSDDQLAYYVAQAREVVDLSVLSQKQILQDLQQLANQPVAAGSESA